MKLSFILWYQHSGYVCELRNVKHAESQNLPTVKMFKDLLLNVILNVLTLKCWFRRQNNIIFNNSSFNILFGIGTIICGTHDTPNGVVGIHFTMFK